MSEDRWAMIAVCGLDCESCTLRRLPYDEEAAQTEIAWFRSMGWLKEGEGVAEAVARKMYCTGCHGSRDTHWSADCAILRCAVDERGLDYCYECHEFPCHRLTEWAGRSERYTQALERLRGFHTSRRQAMADLAASRTELLESLLFASEEELLAPGAVGEWSVKDLLSHIIGWDRWEQATMQALVRGEEPDCSPVVDGFEATNKRLIAPWRSRSLDDVLVGIESAREDLAAFCEALPGGEYFRPRAYRGRDWTFSDAPLQVIADHEIGHTADLKEWRKRVPKSDTGHKGVLLSALRAARDELWAAAALVPGGEAESRPACGEWTLKDIFGHLADWEIFGVAELERMLAGRPANADEGFDLDAWNAAHVHVRARQPMSDVRADLDSARQVLMAALEAMSQEDLARTYPFPGGGKGTPYQFAVSYVEHDREHARVLRELFTSEAH